VHDEQGDGHELQEFNEDEDVVT